MFPALLLFVVTPILRHYKELDTNDNDCDLILVQLVLYMMFSSAVFVTGMLVATMVIQISGQKSLNDDQDTVFLLTKTSDSYVKLRSTL